MKTKNNLTHTDRRNQGSIISSLSKSRPDSLSSIRCQRSPRLLNNNSHSHVPLLSNVINDFFQATAAMEDEILLPSRLKDIPLEELYFDTTIQADNWYQLYSFIREIRNQLTYSQPFPDDGQGTSLNEQIPVEKSDVDSEAYITHDSSTGSSIASISSSDGTDQSQQTSELLQSCQSIREDLKYHYYGFLTVLSTLTSVTDRVTEKYREQYKV